MKLYVHLLPFSSYSELLTVTYCSLFCRNSPILTYPPEFIAPIKCDPVRILLRPLAVSLEHVQSLEYVWRCLCDPKFSRFNTIPACDRHADTWWRRIPR